MSKTTSGLWLLLIRVFFFFFLLIMQKKFCIGILFSFLPSVLYLNVSQFAPKIRIERRFLPAPPHPPNPKSHNQKITPPPSQKKLIKQRQNKFGRVLFFSSGGGGELGRESAISIIYAVSKAIKRGWGGVPVLERDTHPPSPPRYCGQSLPGSVLGGESRAQTGSYHCTDKLSAFLACLEGANYL